MKQAELPQQDIAVTDDFAVPTTDHDQTKETKAVPAMTTVTEQESQPVPTMTEQQSQPVQTITTVTKQQPVPMTTTMTEQQPVPTTSTVTKQQFQSASKRKSFFKSPKISVKHKYAKVSNAHSQISTMAQSKCIEIDEQLCLMKAREDREKELHKLNIQKLQREVDVLNAKEAYLKEKQQRQVAAHKIDMQIKEVQLKLLEKQLQ